MHLISCAEKAADSIETRAALRPEDAASQNIVPFTNGQRLGPGAEVPAAPVESTVRRGTFTVKSVKYCAGRT
jgi:hypothetical protein